MQVNLTEQSSGEASSSAKASFEPAEKLALHADRVAGGLGRAKHGWLDWWIAGLSALSVVAVVTALLARASWRSDNNSAPEPDVAGARVGASPLPRHLIRTAKVVVSRQRRPWQFYGVTRSRERATLSFTVGGRLQARPVEVGMHVKPGQVVARLDSDPLIHSRQSTAASLRELDARLAQKQRDRERTLALFERDVVPLSEYEAERSAVEALSASREATRAQLSEATRIVGEAVLRSDFAGEVVAVFLEPGEYAPPGAPVVAISGSAGLEVRVDVPEAAVGALREGLDAEVRLPLLNDDTFHGRVSSIGNAAPERGGLFPVLVSLEQSDGLRPGLTAEILVVTEGREVTSVPVSAIVDPSGAHPHVLLAKRGRVHEVPVRLSTVDGDRVVVSGKLGNADRVVVAGHQYLLDGDAVTVLE